MRFVGGKISKNENGVTVNTPAGALAIRGGMAQGSVKGPNVIFSFLYGKQMTLGKYTVFQPGNTIDTTSGTPVIRPTTPGDIAAVMASLTNGNTGFPGNKPGDGPNPDTAKLLSTQSLNQLISDANATQIQNEIDDQLNNQPSDQPAQQTVALGYAAGIYGQTSDNEDDDPVGTLNTLSPTDFALLFDASGTFAGASSTLFVNGGEPGMGGAKIVYSPISLPPELAEELPDDLAETLFIGAASSEADPNAFKVYENTIEGENGPELDQLAQLNSGEALLVGVSGAGEAFCATCDFMKWGAWLTILDFQTDPEGSPDLVNVAGWWVAGDLPTIGQLPLQGTATYTGVTYGNVAAWIEDGCESFWDTYTASGTVNMQWDFNQRAGVLEISNFDATGPYGPLNVSGRMDVPGEIAENVNAINRFSGPLLGTLGSAPYPYSNNIDGGAVGSFAANGTDKTAGVIGNWGVGNDYYKASGIFGAGRVGAIDPNGRLEDLPPKSFALTDGPH
jgi:hypothetical protein